MGINQHISWLTCFSVGVTSVIVIWIFFCWDRGAFYTELKLMSAYNNHFTWSTKCPYGRRGKLNSMGFGIWAWPKGQTASSICLVAWKQHVTSMWVLKTFLPRNSRQSFLAFPGFSGNNWQLWNTIQNPAFFVNSILFDPIYCGLFPLSINFSYAYIFRKKEEKLY